MRRRHRHHPAPTGHAQAVRRHARAWRRATPVISAFAGIGVWAALLLAELHSSPDTGEPWSRDERGHRRFRTVLQVVLRLVMSLGLSRFAITIALSMVLFVCLVGLIVTVFVVRSSVPATTERIPSGRPT